MVNRIYELGLWLQGKKASSVCFTGHRPKDLHGYVQKPYMPLVNYIIALCARLNSQLGVETFISGGAQGFDQMAFWAIENLKKQALVKNKVYIPFSKQPSRWKATGLFSQAEHSLMLSRADEVRIIANDPADFPATVQALHGRNHAMVADSDIVIALLAPKAWNWETAKGGTAECVRYARKAGKPVIAVKYDPAAARVTETVVIDD